MEDLDFCSLNIPRRNYSLKIHLSGNSWAICVNMVIPWLMSGQRDERFGTITAVLHHYGKWCRSAFLEAANYSDKSAHCHHTPHSATKGQLQESTHLCPDWPREDQLRCHPMADGSNGQHAMSANCVIQSWGMPVGCTWSVPSLIAEDGKSKFFCWITYHRRPIGPQLFVAAGLECCKAPFISLGISECRLAVPWNATFRHFFPLLPYIHFWQEQLPVVQCSWECFLTPLPLCKCASQQEDLERQVAQVCPPPQKFPFSAASKIF